MKAVLSFLLVYISYVLIPIISVLGIFDFRHFFQVAVDRKSAPDREFNSYLSAALRDDMPDCTGLDLVASALTVAMETRAVVRRRQISANDEVSVI